MTRNDNTAFGTKAQPPSAKRTDAPITAHPGFPLLVAIWFAALLGIGSMVLPTALIERAATASGLASILPAANPPLGMTARILLALIAAALGGALGFLVARKAAAQAGTRVKDDQASDLHLGEDRNEPNEAALDPPAKRPISAREELGTMTLDDPVDDTDLPGPHSISGRRRALSVTDEAGDGEIGDGATGDDKIGVGDFSIGDYGDLDKDWPSQAHQDLHHEVDSTDLPAAPSPWNNGVFDPAASVAETTPQTGPDALDLADYTEPDPSEALPDYEIPASNNSPFGPPRSDDIGEENAIAGAEPAIPHAFDDNTEFPKESREPETVFLTGQPAQSGAAFENPARTESFAHSEAGGDVAGEVTPKAEPAPDAASQTHSEPSLGELVERFARALQAREQVNAQGTVTPLEPLTPATSDHDPFAAPAEPAQPAFLTPKADPSDTQVPAALRPVSFESSDEDDEFDDEDASDFPDLSLSLGAVRKPFNPPQADASPACIATEFSSSTDSAFGSDEDQYEVDGAFGRRESANGASPAENQYDPFSSLLAMKNSAGPSRGFVQIDDDGAADDGAPANSTAEPTPECPAADASDEPVPHPAHTGMKFDARPAASAPSAPSSAALPQSNAVPKIETPVPDNEQALREALEKLQRMSGAA